MNTIEEFAKYLRKGDVYLYGAGVVARRCSLFCHKRKIDINGFIVTEREGNPLEIDSKPVYTLGEWQCAGVETGQMNIIVALSGGSVRWIDEFLSKPKFKSVVFISGALHEELKITELADQYESIQNEYKINYEYPRSEVRLGVLTEKDTQLPLCRVAKVEGMNLFNSLVQNASRYHIKELFGELINLPYVKVPGLSEEVVQKERIEVYIATSHLDCVKAETLNPRGFIPIQCGAALTNIRKRFITDNTGKNISEKNKEYSECTGLYWIWKNTSGQAYVGLCHYRRRLTLDDISVRYIKDHDIDVVVTLPQFERLNIQNTFRRYLSERDWILLRQKVIEYDIGYKECFTKYEAGHFYFPCNVNLWKREWFDRYCAFAFNVVGSIEDYYIEHNIVREDRFAGYLIEQLPALFVMRHRAQLSVACAEIEWVE